MLLPLPTAKVRSLSLENHLALSTVCAGRGDLDRICCPIQVIYLAYFLRSETAAGEDIDLYRHAEAELDSCIKRLEHDQPCLLLDQDQTVIERALVLYDEQLATVPMFRYLEAWERIQRFVASGKHSPMPKQQRGSDGKRKR
ncbi:hypothetical protein [Burkholderia metallica]|uniref:hypothetical protein n=1 Tax=Burkholderia metallica TaxID=488729 RepID=UPI001CF52FCD|nr:hypothetical protein [Burkholderia metallica]MCA8023630.1 hypothetical protein [Burkholderia metallica]